MPSPPKVTLYYLPPSHYNEKARKILEFKGIPHDVVEVPYMDHSAVIKASGQDYTPFIAVPGQKKGVLWHEVADWSEGRVPDPTLYPGADKARTRALSRLVEHWAHQVVEETVWRYVVADVPKVIKDEDARWRFVEFQERKRGPLEVLALRKPEFLEGVKEVCGLAEECLGSSDYLLGSEPSLADFALYGALHPLKYSGNEIPKEFAGLRAWHKRMDAV